MLPGRLEYELTFQKSMHVCLLWHLSRHEKRYGKS